MPLVRPGQVNSLVAAVEAHRRELSARWTRIQGGELEDRPDLLRYVVGLQVSFTNGVTAARLTSSNVEKEVEASVELFRTRGVPALWWVGPLTEPDDLPEYLERHGFHHEEDVPWLARSLGDLPGPTAESELRVETVTGPELQEAWLEAIGAGFGQNDRVEGAMARLAEAVGYGAQAKWIRFVGFLGSRPVASSGLMLAAGVAGIYNVATEPRFRRRGYGAAMTMEALRVGRDRGYRLAVLGSSPMARSLYERLGFRQACVTRVYEWLPYMPEEYAEEVRRASEA